MRGRNVIPLQTFVSACLENNTLKGIQSSLAAEGYKVSLPAISIRRKSVNNKLISRKYKRLPDLKRLGARKRPPAKTLDDVIANLGIEKAY